MTALEWLAPPVIGAVIGFVTNDIAIRMLFRPLREYRVLGLRVPFTPGIIPRRRRELADAIGRMVSQELITASTIDSYLEREGTREAFRSWVSRSTSELFDLKLAALVPSDTSGESISGLGEELLQGFLQSSHLPSLVGAAVGVALEALDSTSLERLAGDTDVSEAIARAVVRLIPVGSERGKGVDPEVVDAAVRAAKLLAAPAGRGLERWLSGPEVRPELVRRLRELLQGALEKLSTLQRFFLRAGQYERRLEEKLPEIVDETIQKLAEFLGDAVTQEAVGEAVRKALEHPGAVEGEAPPESESADGHGEVIRLALTDVVAAWVRPFVGRPLGTSAAELSGVSREALAARIAAGISERARQPGASRSLIASVRQAAAGYPAASTEGEGNGVTLGELLGMTPEAKRRLDEALAGKSLELLRARLQDLLAGFDVRGMVVQRINGLDVEDVEKLLTMVISRHLKWINVFGALLGAVIGFAQVLIRLL